MSALVPRWEWRGFGDELRAVESIFGRESSKQVVESDEVYVLSVRGTDGVKVRDELMDVKHLLEVNDDGLEQWVPVMKTGFPVSATDVGSVLRALRVDAQSSRLARAAYTLPEFLDDVVGPHPDLLAVEVHKRRERYTVGGCMAEVSEISAGRGSTHTVAIESEDAKRVIQTVRDVGLASRPNVSLVRGLKAMVGFGVERFAVVDVGTNSVKFHIGERGADGKLAHWSSTGPSRARLGDGLQETGRLQYPEPMERTVAAIAEMAEEARQHKVAAIAAVGTAGLRIAPNSADLVEAVQSRSGVLLEVISGEQEGPSRVPRRDGGDRSGARVSSRVRHGRGQTRSSRSGPGRRSRNASASMWAPSRYTERYRLDGVVSEEVLAQALRRARLTTSVVSTITPTPEVLVGDGRGGHEPHQRLRTDARPVRRGRRAGNRARPVRRSIGRSLVYRTRRVLDERREIVGLEPPSDDIILTGACIVRTVLRQLREGLVDGQRPRPAEPVLHEVMGELGHIAREDVEAIADVLNLSVAEVHGVVSFYHDFRTEPPAAHAVALCRGEACQSVGAEALYDDTRARAGSLGSDVEVAEVFCLATARSGRPAPSTAASTAGCPRSGSTRSRRDGVDASDCTGVRAR